MIFDPLRHLRMLQMRRVRNPPRASYARAYRACRNPLRSPRGGCQKFIGARANLAKLSYRTTFPLPDLPRKTLTFAGRVRLSKEFSVSLLLAEHKRAGPLFHSHKRRGLARYLALRSASRCRFQLTSSPHAASTSGLLRPEL